MRARPAWVALRPSKASASLGSCSTPCRPTWPTVPRRLRASSRTGTRRSRTALTTTSSPSGGSDARAGRGVVGAARSRRRIGAGEDPAGAGRERRRDQPGAGGTVDRDADHHDRAWFGRADRARERPAAAGRLDRALPGANDQPRTTGAADRPCPTRCLPGVRRTTGAVLPLRDHRLACAPCAGSRIALARSISA